MELKTAIEKLKDDEYYYGAFGRKFLSNSDIRTLLNNPLEYGKPSPPNTNFLVGGYFHTAVLEPEKLDKYKIVDASSRNTKIYKEAAKEEMHLLQKEVNNINKMMTALNSSDACTSLIKGIDVEYEKPMIKNIFGKLWKGKADIVNHDERLIIDLKTTSDVSRFRSSAYKWGYDSQAYIYKQLFGYDFLFIAIDKISHQIGIFDCSKDFYSSGEDKVEKAVEAYELFYNTEGFDPKQYFLQQTL